MCITSQEYIKTYFEIGIMDMVIVTAEVPLSAVLSADDRLSREIESQKLSRFLTAIVATVALIMPPLDETLLDH